MPHTHTLIRGTFDGIDSEGNRVRLHAGEPLTPTPAMLRAFSDNLTPIDSSEESAPEEPGEARSETGADTPPQEGEVTPVFIARIRNLNVKQVLAGIESGDLPADMVRQAELAGRKRKGILSAVGGQPAGTRQRRRL